jgi:hypothetical protein
VPRDHLSHAEEEDWRASLLFEGATVIGWDEHGHAHHPYPPSSGGYECRARILHTNRLAGLCGAAAVATACSESDPGIVGANARPDSGACSTEPPHDHDHADAAADTGGDVDHATAHDAGADAPASTLLSEGKLTYEQVRALCDARGGHMETYAACAGANRCRGLSYLAYDPFPLTEHTCKGSNSCSGFGCVVLPKDDGRSGKEIYEAICNGCHGNKEKAIYNVYVRPGTTPAAAEAKFVGSSTARLERIVAFGTQGFNDNDSPYSNMPAYKEKYSRAEIQRAIVYLRTLARGTSQYEIYAPTDDGGI